MLFISAIILAVHNVSIREEDLAKVATMKGFDSEDWQVEYFVASDASAIIEHTKEVLYLEDDDVAFVEDGGITFLTILHFFHLFVAILQL